MREAATDMYTHMCIEPWRNGCHVWTTSKNLLVISVSGSRHRSVNRCIVTAWPSIPLEAAGRGPMSLVCLIRVKSLNSPISSCGVQVCSLIEGNKLKSVYLTSDCRPRSEGVASEC